MVNTKILSPTMSFKGFDYKKLLLSLEKPLVGLTVAFFAQLALQVPAYSAIIGGVGTVIYNATKYFFNEYKK